MHKHPVQYPDYYHGVIITFFFFVLEKGLAAVHSPDKDDREEEIDRRATEWKARIIMQKSRSIISHNVKNRRQLKGMALFMAREENMGSDLQYA